MDNGIPRVNWKDIDEVRFEQEFSKPLQPVIITGSFDHWAARTKWTPEFFKKEHGEREVIVDGKKWKLGSLIHEIERSTPSSAAPYLRNEPIVKWPDVIRSDIEPIPFCTQGNWLESVAMKYINHWRSPELYIGGAGAKFPVLHYDEFHLHAFLMQLYGEKEYLVYAPDQLQYMYRGEGIVENKSQVNDPENPDLVRFPKFALARGMRFRLLPGETLFVPSGWWHTAKILSTSITVSLNGVTESNWKGFSGDIVKEAAKRSILRAQVANLRLAFCAWRHALYRVN